LIDFILVHGKTILLVLLLGLFCGVLLYVFGNRGRSARLERYGEIPFLDDDAETGSKAENSEVDENDRRHH